MPDCKRLAVSTKEGGIDASSIWLYQLCPCFPHFQLLLSPLAGRNRKCRKEGFWIQQLAISNPKSDGADAGTGKGRFAPLSTWEFRFAEARRHRSARETHPCDIAN